MKIKQSSKYERWEETLDYQRLHWTNLCQTKRCKHMEGV